MRDLRHEASTRNGTSGRRILVQGTLCARLSSWARCIARNSATRASTRTAPRSSRFARQTSGQPPATVTPPRIGAGPWKPFSRASATSADSRPGAVTRKISKSPSLMPLAYRGAARISTSFYALLDAPPAQASVSVEGDTIVECRHGLQGPLPLWTRPLLVPQPGDRHRRALRLLALRPARRRPVVALHPGGGFHA